MRGVFNPTREEPSNAKSSLDASVRPEWSDGDLRMSDRTKKAENLGDLDNETSNGRLEERDDNDFRSVASSKEEVSVADFFVSDSHGDDFLDKDMQMVLVEEEGQALVTFPNPQIEESLKLSLEGVNMVDGVEEGCSV